MVEFLNEPEKDPLYIRIMKVVSFYWLLDEALNRTYVFRRLIAETNYPRKKKIIIAIDWILNFPGEICHYYIYRPVRKKLLILRRKIYLTKDDKLWLEVWGDFND